MKKEDLYKLDAVDVYKLILKEEIIKFPKGFWEKPNSLQWAKEITKWFIEEYLKLSDEELKKQLSVKLFADNRLDGMTVKLFNHSAYRAIENAYPGKFKAWEFNYLKNSYWNIDIATKCIRWLIEEKLKLTDEQLKEQLSYTLFKNNGLAGMMKLFNDSPYKAIENAYPGKFKRTDFKNCNYYKGDV